MFILDTNIISAMMLAEWIPEMAAWIKSQQEESLFTTAVSKAEILSGIAIMPAGRRRADLETVAEAIFLDDFEGRVLAFDTKAAAVYSELFALRRRSGRPAAMPDLMIAAIAKAHEASVVTRDTGGFEGCGVRLVNPWEV